MDYESFYNEAATLYQQGTLTFEAWLKQMAQVAHQHKFKFTELVEIVHSITGVRMTTDKWFAVVLENDAPGTDRFPIQMGCHLEEIVEMLVELELEDELQQEVETAVASLTKVADALKTARADVGTKNEVAFNDSILDQRVTGTGLLKMQGVDVAETVARVDVANFTKFVNGKPLYKEGGKIAKGPNFWNPEF